MATMTLAQMQAYLSERKNSFVLPPFFNHELFRKFANGFFQAEGYIGCRLRPGVGRGIFPVFEIAHNYNPAALVVFLTLWHVLGRKCNLYIIQSASGKFVIVLRSEDWTTILTIVWKYFNLGYGEKYVNFFKLKVIHDYIKSNDPMIRAIAVTLAYNLTLYGAPKSKSLLEILKAIGLPTNDIKLPEFQDNSSIFETPFFIGLILGDGSLLFRIRLSSTGAV